MNYGKLNKYRGSSGKVTERRILDIHPENATTIDAFCHLRQARRSFKIERIVHAINAATGEIVNPWKFVSDGPGDNARETLESLTWQVLPAVKALKFFTLSTRGFK